MQWSRFSLKQRLLYTARTMTQAFVSEKIWPNHVTVSLVIKKRLMLSPSFFLYLIFQQVFLQALILRPSTCYICVEQSLQHVEKVFIFSWTCSGNFESGDIKRPSPTKWSKTNRNALKIQKAASFPLLRSYYKRHHCLRILSSSTKQNLAFKLSVLLRM